MKALPFILIGIAVVIVIGQYIQKRKSDQMS